MNDDAFPSVATVCGEHPESDAAFQCASCGELLCSRCVTMAGTLFICERCGERAMPLTPPEEDWSSARPSDASQEEERLQAMGQVAHHVVVPAAVIAMVGALLFFLVDLRSVFLPMGMAIKWVGFCFVVATVLIARYGKLSAFPERQTVYSLFLGGAMMLVIWVSPWDKNAGPGSTIVNTVIVLVVWRFATRLTNALGREGERPETPKKRLYGLDRLEMEAWQREQEGGSGKRKAPTKRAQADVHGNASAGVARLAMLAVVGFALAEPILMSGPPEVGVRALAAVVVFLLGTGLVLAASSAIGSLRVVRAERGQVSEGVVPFRLAVAAVAVLVALALMIAVPGVTYRGRGEIQPEDFEHDGQGVIADESLDGEGSGRDPGGEQGETEGEGDEEGEEGRPGEDGRSAVVRTYLHLLQLFAHLGYPRPERHTPYEFLQGLPPHLAALRSPLQGVTELYVRTAYGGDPLADADRRTAIEALVAVERKAAEAG